MARLVAALLAIVAGCSQPSRSDFPVSPNPADLKEGEILTTVPNRVWNWREDPRCVRDSSASTTRNYFAFDPPLQMKGRASSGFERSAFYEEAAGTAKRSTQSPDSRAWLEVDQFTLGRTAPVGASHIYPTDFDVVFIGRKAHCIEPEASGGYGHIGAYQSLVLVDRFISIRMFD
jgi:hypothetical protein